MSDMIEFENRPEDPKEIAARKKLEDFFDKNREQVFYSRQIEVLNEDEYFHWITNRALRNLHDSGIVQIEERETQWKGKIKLVWHRSFRYYKRAASRVVNLVEEYSNSNVGGAIGLYAQQMVMGAFARSQFVMLGENTNEFRGKKWEQSNHDLDYIFERDEIAYGIELKLCTPEGGRFLDLITSTGLSQNNFAC